MGTEKALVWGIFIHKIPIGMVLFLMISQVRISILMKILCLLLFAPMSPAGSFILEKIY